MVNDSGFLLTPTNVMRLANFMVSVGSIGTKPEPRKERSSPNIDPSCGWELVGDPHCPGMAGVQVNLAANGHNP